MNGPRYKCCDHCQPIGGCLPAKCRDTPDWHPVSCIRDGGVCEQGRTEVPTPSAPAVCVREFHQAFGISPYSDRRSPQGREDIRRLRANLIVEEALEVCQELGFMVHVFDDDHTVVLTPIEGFVDVDRNALAKELADLKYVTYGADDTFGIPGAAVFAEVHRSNMSKLGADGNPVYREDGKVLKGPGFEQPQIARVLGITP